MASASFFVERFCSVCLGSVRSGWAAGCGSGERAEVLLDHALHPRLLEIADDHEHGVARRVERLEEVLHVGQGRGLQVLQVAVEVVRVVPVGVGVLRHVEPREPAVRLVQHVDLDLVHHHALLVGQVVLRDVEAAHAVGLGPECRLQRVGRQHLEVVGEVESRRSVQHTAVALDEPDELHLAEVGRPLEHHVFEEVRESGPVLRLHAKADLVVDRHDDRGRRGVARQHHLQAVGQRVGGDRDVVQGRGRLGLQRRRGCRDHGRGESQAGRGQHSCQHASSRALAQRRRRRQRHTVRSVRRLSRDWTSGSRMVDRPSRRTWHRTASRVCGLLVTTRPAAMVKSWTVKFCNSPCPRL